MNRMPSIALTLASVLVGGCSAAPGEDATGTESSALTSWQSTVTCWFFDNCN